MFSRNFYLSNFIPPGSLLSCSAFLLPMVCFSLAHGADCQPQYLYPSQGKEAMSYQEAATLTHALMNMATYLSAQKKTPDYIKLDQWMKGPGYPEFLKNAQDAQKSKDPGYAKFLKDIDEHKEMSGPLLTQAWHVIKKSPYIIQKTAQIAIPGAITHLGIVYCMGGNITNPLSFLVQMGVLSHLGTIWDCSKGVCHKIYDQLPEFSKLFEKGKTSKEELEPSTHDSIDSGIKRRERNNTEFQSL